VHDITKLKEAERKMQNFNNELKQLVEEKTHHLELANKRLQSLNELKDEFIAVASHELRSPLTSVRGYLSFLMEKESLETLPESARQYLTKAYNNVESLNYLVNNILDVSRLDTGRFELQKVKTDLLQLAKDVLESLSFQANERKIKITFKGPSNIKNLFLKIDPIRISQVFRNLIDNSIKYSKKDTGISFEISRELGWAVIKISDQGVGIPQDMVDKVFEKFTQLKNPNTGQRGGAGLGLFIVKRIIQLHDGIIKVESNYGQGSVFTILLPMMGEYKEAK
jgi:signal transduction histidine kinase